MGLPKDLISKSTQRLTRPKPPTAGELLRGNLAEPLSAERKAGIKAQGVLASRYLAQAESEVAARQKAEAEAEEAISDRVWQAYLKRCSEAI
jgi:hypothetical protein